MVGETVSRYRVIAWLGSGSMGDVYRAEDTRLLRPVALKFVKLSGDEAAASRRLLAEARAASALSHPNIAVVYEVDEVDRDGGRLGFIAMEYIAGRTLAEIAAAGPIPLDTVLDLGGQIAGALAEAHSRGLVHRDIKPSNVMVTGNGRVKILDFGLALWSAPAVSGEGSTRTADLGPDTARIVGTFPYMSPEQATGQAVDGRSDMFSLGAMLYELVSGKRPFDGTSMVQILSAVIHVDPPVMATPGGDPRLAAVERIVRRMIAKHPDRRYADLGAVAHALAAAARGEGAATGAGDSRTPILAISDFQNITANAEDDWLGTGISETVSADLRGFEGVSVVPRGRLHALLRIHRHGDRPAERCAPSRRRARGRRALAALRQLSTRRRDDARDSVARGRRDRANRADNQGGRPDDGDLRASGSHRA